MPNDCRNTLMITGPAELIAAFREGISNPGDRRGPALLQSHLPMPSDITPGQQRDWMLSSWGVDHGGDYDTVILDGPDPTVLTIEFETAWRPPSQGLQALAEKFPGLRFENTYDEPACDLRGRDVFQYPNRGDDRSARAVDDIRLAVQRAARELERTPLNHDLPESAWAALQGMRDVVSAGMEELSSRLTRETRQEVER